MALEKDDIMALIAILQKGLDDNDSPKPKKRTKKSSKNSSTNKFLEMGLSNAHKDDIAIDKLLHKYPPTPRRPKIKIIDVVCRVCGKKESINPVLLNESPDRYKCNKCCSSPG